MSTSLASLSIAKPIPFIIGGRNHSTDDFSPAGTAIALAGPIGKGKRVARHIVKPRATRPTSIPLPDEPGIYKFEIEAGSLPAFYIGKAKSLRSRMNQYGEMVRALVALHRGYAVRLDKNPYRYVHYALARAVVRSQAISVTYISGSPLDTETIRKREELLVLAKLTHHYDSIGRFQDVLNCWGRFVSIPSSQLSQRWRAVQSAVR